MRRGTLLLTCSFLVLASSLARAQAERPLRQAAEPQQGHVSMTLRPLWELGSEADDLLIGRISQIVVDAEGTAYALDTQLAQVQVISADGEWLRSIGREGEGPGEFRQPNDLFLTDDGEVAVVQAMPAKIALLSPDGTSLDDHPLPAPNEGFRFLQAGCAFDGGVVLASSAFVSGDDGSMQQSTILYGIDDDGMEVGEYLRAGGGIDFATMTVDEAAMDNVARRWTVTTDGRVVFAPRFEQYLLEFRALDGTPLYAIERDVPPRPRTDAEKKAVTENFRMNINGQDVKVVPRENARMIDGLISRPEGRLWVMLYESPEIDREAGRVCRFDEFDAEGGYQRQIELHGPVDLEDARLFVRGDRAFAVHTGDEDDEGAEIRLVCYALESGT